MSRSKSTDTGITLIPSETNLFQWQAFLKVGASAMVHPQLSRYQDSVIIFGAILCKCKKKASMVDPSTLLTLAGITPILTAPQALESRG